MLDLLEPEVDTQITATATDPDTGQPGSPQLTSGIASKVSGPDRNNIDLGEEATPG